MSAAVARDSEDNTSYQNDEWKVQCSIKDATRQKSVLNLNFLHKASLRKFVWKLSPINRSNFKATSNKFQAFVNNCISKVEDKEKSRILFQSAFEKLVIIIQKVFAEREVNMLQRLKDKGKPEELPDGFKGVKYGEDLILKLKELSTALKSGSVPLPVDHATGSP